MTQKELDDTPLEYFDLGTLVIHELKSKGIETIGQLAKLGNFGVE